MASSKNSVATIYNPKNLSRDELIDRFVVRQKMFKKLYKEISSTKMIHPEQHILVEGKRGMGKTTLLLRLGYEIENDSKLNKWLIPVIFNEEEYSVRKLFKFWERVIELLEESREEFEGISEDVNKLSKNFKSDNEYEKALYSLLSKRLQSNKQKVILFIDNFGDMFRKFNDKEAHRLRKILQTSADIRIIAASSIVLEAFYEYNHPFYEFFKVERLEGLDTKATLELLLKLGEVYGQEKVKYIVENQKGRIEALRRLTGGVIRTIILLFEIFLDDPEGNAFIDLESILDRVTPLYKHRMDDLPAPQQEIVEAIALSWDAVSVKEICERTRVESKVVSALLGLLVKNEIVNKIKTNKKNYLYQINERFFNIWFLMRHGRKGEKNKVIWLVRFLEEWCNEKEIIDRARKHIDFLKKGDYNSRAAFYMSEALAHAKHLPKNEQHELLQETNRFLTYHKSKYIQHLTKSDINLYKKGEAFYMNKDYDKALNCFLKMRDKDNFRIAYSYHKGPENLTEAAKYYRKAIRSGSSNALNNLGLIYESDWKKYAEAAEFYEKAVKLGNGFSMFNLALLYKSKLDNPKKAEKYYLLAVKNDDVDAMYNLANLYAEEFSDPEKALKYYLMAVEKKDIKAMSNLAYLYIEYFEDYDAGEKYFKMAIESGLLYTKDYVKAVKKNPLNYHFTYLMARGQNEFLYRFFTNEKAKKINLKERLKPIYYAILFFLQDKYPNEYLRMGNELTETVAEITEQAILLSEEIGAGNLMRE